jgi:hypothetical protein
MSRILSAVRTALRGAPPEMAQSSKVVAPSPPPSSPGPIILTAKQARNLAAVANLRVAEKLAPRETPRNMEHLKRLVESLTPDEKAWPQKASATLPKQTPAEVEKILALFPPDDSLKIN